MAHSSKFKGWQVLSHHDSKRDAEKARSDFLRVEKDLLNYQVQVEQAERRYEVRAGDPALELDVLVSTWDTREDAEVELSYEQKVSSTRELVFRIAETEEWVKAKT